MAAYNGLEEYQKFVDILIECIELESEVESGVNKVAKVYNLGKQIQKLRKIEQEIENIQSSEMLPNNIE